MSNFLANLRKIECKQKILDTYLYNIDYHTGIHTYFITFFIINTFYFRELCVDPFSAFSLWNTFKQFNYGIDVSHSIVSVLLCQSTAEILFLKHIWFFQIISDSLNIRYSQMICNHLQIISEFTWIIFYFPIRKISRKFRGFL